MIIPRVDLNDSLENSQASFFGKTRDMILSVIFLPGGHRREEIPDPISNSEVKLSIADGTTHKSVGE